MIRPLITVDGYCWPRAQYCTVTAGFANVGRMVYGDNHSGRDDAGLARDGSRALEYAHRCATCHGPARAAGRRVRVLHRPGCLAAALIWARHPALAANVPGDMAAGS